MDDEDWLIKQPDPLDPELTAYLDYTAVLP